jgi:hypothetical protein
MRISFQFGLELCSKVQQGRYLEVMVYRSVYFSYKDGGSAVFSFVPSKQ